MKKIAVTPTTVFGVDANGAFELDLRSGFRTTVSDENELMRRIPSGIPLIRAEDIYYQPYGWQDFVGRWSFVLAVAALIGFIFSTHVWPRRGI